MKHQLINYDAIEWLKACIDCGMRYDMIFADPPDNKDVKYKGFKDKIENYEEFLEELVGLSLQVSDVFWISFRSDYLDVMGGITLQMKEAFPDVRFKPCVQTFTFGNHNHRDLCQGYRPLFRYLRNGAKLYPDQIRVPSWRQLNGDKRADPRGRVPSDVFDFTRVTGNSKQRRVWSPTQLHEGLYERCIKLSCKPGSTVMDLFAGSGTLGRVGERCGVSTTMVELSREVCDHILADQPDVEEV
jgi:DNA modification methylase